MALNSIERHYLNKKKNETPDLWQRIDEQLPKAEPVRRSRTYRFGGAFAAVASVLILLAAYPTFKNLLSAGHSEKTSGVNNEMQAENYVAAEQAKEAADEDDTELTDAGAITASGTGTPMLRFKGTLYTQSDAQLDLDPAKLIQIGEIQDVNEESALTDGQCTIDMTGAKIYDSGENLIVYWNGAYLLFSPN